MNDSVYIPVKTKHRIKNISEIEPLVFIEIQTGETLDENDIIRFEDTYGRVK
jgi:mannose-6-phosphate isomerase-like protein (cupin superfamily)